MLGKKSVSFGLISLPKNIDYFVYVCTSMFISSADYVNIQPLVHRAHNTVVAKNVTPKSFQHIISTTNPHSSFFRYARVILTTDRYSFSTLYTSTTTTIFKLVTRKSLEQKKSSLTIPNPKSLQLKIC